MTISWLPSPSKQRRPRLKRLTRVRTPTTRRYLSQSEQPAGSSARYDHRMATRTPDETSTLAFLKTAERLMKQMRKKLKATADGSSARELNVLERRIDQLAGRKKAIRANLVARRTS